MEASISLTRDSGYADRIRDYLVMLDGKEIGSIADGESKEFVVPPGNHDLRLKIDWCGSRVAKIELKVGENIAFRCGSALRGYKLLFSLYYAIVARDRYLWLEAV